MTPSRPKVGTPPTDLELFGRLAARLLPGPDRVEAIRESLEELVGVFGATMGAVFACPAQGALAEATLLAQAGGSLEPGSRFAVDPALEGALASGNGAAMWLDGPLVLGAAPLDDRAVRTLVQVLRVDDAHVGALALGLTAVPEAHGLERLVEALAPVMARAVELTHGTSDPAAAHGIAQEGYELVARAARDGLWDWDLRTGRVTYSERWRSVLGCDGEVADSPEEWFSRVVPEDLPRLKAAIERHLRGDTAYFEVEYRMRHACGEQRWMLGRGVALRDADGAPRRMAGSQTDLTVRKRFEDQLLHDAFHDPLTRLPNRTMFMDRLARAIRQPGRRALAVVLLDLDEFKIINDSLGHVEGDQLLVKTARRLQERIGGSDTVARMGGDEFAILVEDLAEADEARELARELVASIAQPFSARGQDVFTSASAGIAVSTEVDDVAEHKLRDADTALYRAKAAGRGHIQLFDQEMYARAVHRLRLETDLRRGLRRGEFRVHYQPVVDLRVGHVVGFEALLRWAHPERGLVYPDEFIPVAEDAGLLVPIGRWVVEESCREVQRWQALTGRPVYVSVNISHRQFCQPDLVEQIRRALEQAGIDPATLRIELTESVLMDQHEFARETLQGLRALGVGLDVDDFGTGYSSLAQLQKFPVDTLKIDRSFVFAMGPREEDNAFVRTIITLADNLGLGVVAEGVETPDQAQSLVALGCTRAQGHHFAKAMAPDRARKFLKGR